MLHGDQGEERETRQGEPKGWRTWTGGKVVPQGLQWTAVATAGSAWRAEEHGEPAAVHPDPVSQAGEHQRLRVRSMFAVRHDSPIISNFRLGCIPRAQHAGWDRHNLGAHGLAAPALSNTVGLGFPGYGLIACGNHSLLKSFTEAPIELPLFWTWGQSARLHHKLDQAMMLPQTACSIWRKKLRKASRSPHALQDPRDRRPRSQCWILVHRTHWNVEEPGKGTQAHAYRF